MPENPLPGELREPTPPAAPDERVYWNDEPLELAPPSPIRATEVIILLPIVIVMIVAAVAFVLG